MPNAPRPASAPSDQADCGLCSMRSVLRKKIWIPTRLISALLFCILAWAAGQIWTSSGGDPKGRQVLVTAVVDGDTIHVGRGWRHTRVRLIGVDTPETVHPKKPIEFFGPEASEFTKSSLAGKWVHLEFEPSDQIDAYGRLLAYVFMEDGTFFNRELVRMGYARAYTRFDFRYREDFRLVQEEARQARLGLWVAARQKGPPPIPAGGNIAGQEGPPSISAEGKIIGNVRSKIYHLPGQQHYTIPEEDKVYFATEGEAISAGYRRSKR